MSIQEFGNIYDISARTMNVCRSNRLITLNDLKRYHDYYGGSHLMRGCGEMVKRELYEILKHYNPPPNPVMTDREEAAFRQYTYLTSFKKATFKKYLIEGLFSEKSLNMGNLYTLSIAHPFLEKLVGGN